MALFFGKLRFTLLPPFLPFFCRSNILSVNKKHYEKNEQANRSYKNNPIFHLLIAFQKHGISAQFITSAALFGSIIGHAEAFKYPHAPVNAKKRY